MRFSARDILIELAVVLLITLVVAYLGPFGSFEIGGYELRLIYWSAMIFGGYAIVRPLMLLAEPLSARLALPELPVWIGLVAVAALPVTLLVWFGGGADALPRAPDFLRLYPNVLLLGGLVALVFWVLRKAPDAAALPPGLQPSAAPGRPEPKSAGPRLLQRLEPGQRAEVHALQMEDHYVRVHSARGSVLLLLRIRDAIAEMDGVEGMQVHRSWWVARAAVTGHSSDGRNIILHLHGGLQAPVARSSVEMVRQAGWLADS